MALYSLDGVALFFNNVPITGFGEGGAIEITRNSELWNNKACTGGDIISSKILDESGMATFTLRYASPSNQVLQRFAEARVSGTFLCAWPSGDRVHSMFARVQKYPDIADGNEPGDRVWQIFLEKAKYEFGVGQ